MSKSPLRRLSESLLLATMRPALTEQSLRRRRDPADLKGKRVLLTGASSGIGEAAAEAADWMITAARTRPVRIAPRMAVTAHALNSIAPSAVDAIMKRQRVQPGA